MGGGRQRHAETWRHTERNVDSKAWSYRETERDRERHSERDAEIERRKGAGGGGNQEIKAETK